LFTTAAALITELFDSHERRRAMAMAKDLPPIPNDWSESDRKAWETLVKTGAAIHLWFCLT
jgi:hypothetical protein